SGDFSQLNDHKNLRWFAVLNDLPVGTIGLDRINTRMKSASIGYQVGAEFAGKGLGTRMVREFIRAVFSETNIERLTATVHFENLASQRVLEKVGFIKEGLLRQYLIISGKRVDFYAYAILRDEFK